MINVQCPMCNGKAELSDMDYELSYFVIKCPDICKKEFACGIRDYEVDGEMEHD